MTIDRLQPDDLDAVHALLALNNLPLAGFDDHVATAVVARDDAQPDLACASLHRG